MLQRLTLHEAAKRLAVKDKRTAEKWCKLKGVSIHNESGNKFLYEFELNLVQEHDIMDSLKMKYPDSWQGIFNAFKEGKSIEAYELANHSTRKTNTPNNSSNVPLSKEAKEFIDKYKKK
jgi:hypothetical protein